jgi:hypothetical protein
LIRTAVKQLAGQGREGLAMIATVQHFAAWLRNQVATPPPEAPGETRDKEAKSATPVLSDENVSAIAVLLKEMHRTDPNDAPWRPVR